MMTSWFQGQSLMRRLTTGLLVTWVMVWVMAGPARAQGTPCSATLSQNGKLAVPIIATDIPGQYYWANFSGPDSQGKFQLTDFGPQDPGKFTDCDAADFVTDTGEGTEGVTLTSLSVYDLAYNGKSYWADMGLLPVGADGKWNFKVGRAGLNGSSRSSGIRKGPYLLYNGDNTSMTVMWQTEDNTKQATIAWGPSPSNYQFGPFVVKSNGNGKNQRQFSYNITQLTPNTLTYYQVVVDGEVLVGSFRTAPDSSATSLTFYALGDTRDGIQPFDALSQQILTDMQNSPTLLVHAADYALHGLSEHYWDFDLFNRDSVNTLKLFTMLQMMGPLGNHEGYPGSSFHLDLVNIGLLFYKYFPYSFYVQPIQHDRPVHFYYSFGYGPAHFAMLDTWSYSKGMPDSTQLSWLQQDLTSSKPWKIVTLHTPIIDCCSSQPDLAAAVTPLLKAGGVQMVIQGHRHYYSRVTQNGIVYLTLGGGGAKLTPANKILPDAIGIEAFHYAKISLKDNTAAVSVRCQTGTDSNCPHDGYEIDSFTITR
ncbi:MAG: metallophosphoesterase family protein [Deltaproteobacteria bacterium]|nr:metallophosphoesterase family protein [Deltaproteobacteria bacterium]